MVSSARWSAKEFKEIWASYKSVESGGSGGGVFDGGSGKAILEGAGLSSSAMRRKTIEALSYPNFVRGPLLDDMRPFFGPCEVLGTHH